MELEMGGSLFLIGVAIAIAGVIGVLQPPGHRGGALLALAAGAGVGIAGLGLGMPTISQGSDDEFWSLFLVSSIAGFATVIGVLVLTWLRARANEPSAPRAPGP